MADDGTFQLTTFKDGDGAPEGEYSAIIISDETRKDDGDTIVVVPDRLNGRFGNPAESTFKVQVKKVRTKFRVLN